MEIGVKMAFQSKKEFRSGVALSSVQHFGAGFERRWGCAGYARIGTQMTNRRNVTAVLTDSHFLVPLIVFCIGLALLITLH
jgi:hypothetical protein